MPALLLLALAGCVTPSGPSTEQVPVTASDQTAADRRARTRLDLAAAYFGRGQMDTALDEVKQALAAKPDSADAYNLRGLILAAMGDPRLAEESFQHAIQLNPHDADTKHNYGWLLCQSQRFDEGQAQFERALAEPSYRQGARTMMASGICQARAGRLLDAERTLSRAYELDPTSPVTAVNLAEVLYRRGEYERARFYIRRANAVPEQANSQTLWLAARIENRLGNRMGVQDAGAELRKRFPQSPETLAYERGRFDE